MRRRSPGIASIALLALAIGASCGAEEPAGWTAKIEAIPPAVVAKMKGHTWRPGCPVPPESLRYLTISYVDFDGYDRRGHLIVHENLAAEVVEIFKELFAARFPIHSIRLASEFDGSDERSMLANNTSAFNCREVAGKPGSTSNHSYGVAIDINPVQNPAFVPKNENNPIQPRTGEPFLDRCNLRDGMILSEPLDPEIPGFVVYRAFRSRDWLWGGNWYSLKDYQHFEKPSGTRKK